MSEGHGSRATKWDYIRIQAESHKIKESDSTLAKLGNEGWELVDVTYTRHYIHMWFKRPR